MNVHSLAIVIPAYKIDYFQDTLESLRNQTCKNFSVYIGDDSGPADLRSLVKQYESDLNIVYHRFDENLGGKDLVGQWERCIALSRGEPWICLFSDDDVMGERFVEYFLAEKSRFMADYDIYHYNVKVIDSKGNVIKNTRKYPHVIDNWHFYKGKASAKLNSFIVEYIFSRDIYESVGGFEKFDMAWGSDIATWIQMSAGKGIKTVEGEYVYWRRSDKNITPDHSNTMVLKKMDIDVKFISWVNDFFGTPKARRFNIYAFFRLYFFYSLDMTWKQAKDVAGKAYSNGILYRYLYCAFIGMFPLVKMMKFCKSKIITKTPFRTPFFGGGRLS